MLKEMANPLEESPTLVMDTLTGELIDISRAGLNAQVSAIPTETDSYAGEKIVKGLLLGVVWIAYLWIQAQTNSDAMVPFIIAPLAITG